MPISFKFQKEAAEAEKVMKSLGLHHDIKGDGAGLELMIKKRQQMREQNADNFFAHLEAKYGNSKSPSRKGVSCQRTSPLKASAAKKTAKSPKTALKRKR